MFQSRNKDGVVLEVVELLSKFIGDLEYPWDKNRSFNELYVPVSVLYPNKIIIVYSMDKFREDVQREDGEVMKRKVSNIDQARGFGGKFGIEEDRMDKSAVGHDYQVIDELAMEVSVYPSFPILVISIQNNIHILFLNSKVKLEKHASQKDYSTGFGGKYGVQEGSKDKVRYCCTSSLNVMIPNVSSSYIHSSFYSQY